MISDITLANQPKIKERLFSYSETKNDCRLWKGVRKAEGYCQININGKFFGVHRVAYTLNKGAIPNGYVVDHLCGVRQCINPDHLEAVTQQENAKRATRSLTTINAKKTHCIRGHTFDKDNTYRRPNNPNKRDCKACMKLWRMRKENKYDDI